MRSQPVTATQDHAATKLLTELDRHSLAEAGGKGANLGELLWAGLPVPPGFVVTASAYRTHLAAAGLPARIAARLAGLPAEDLAAVAAASRDIMTWIEEASIPDTICVAVEEGYAALQAQAGAANVAVAVRSSATAEDLPDASFAGQQATFLNVHGNAAVLQHVRRCWASLWTPQALAYRDGLGYDHLTVTLAVVVQVMAAADVAGVMFTANPVSGARDEILISASWGLGEAVVSGAVTPDTFVLAADGALRSRTLGSKEVRIVPDGNGVRREPTPAADRVRFSLAEMDLAHLASLAQRVQAHYGTPQDTEWVIGGGRVYLLQARPITTPLAPEPAAIPDSAAVTPPPINRKVTAAAQLMEYWPEPATPLDVSFFCAAGAGMNALYRLMGLCPAPTLPEPVEQLDGRMGVRVVNPRFTPAMFWRPLAQLLGRQGEPLDRWQPVAEQMAAAIRRWQAAEAAALAGPAPASALALLLGRAMAEFGQLLGRRFDAVFFAGIKYSLQLKLWVWLAGGRMSALEDRLMRATPFRTALQNQALARLAQVGVEAGRDSVAFQAAFEGFMAEWGSRPARGMAATPSIPAWREDPAQVLDLVDAIAADPSPLDLAAAWQATEADHLQARAQAEAALWPPLLPAFRRSLERARSGGITREDSLYRMEIVTAAIRHIALLLGDELAQAGRLAARDDVFFLLAGELAAVADGRLAAADLVRRRRAAYAQVVAAHQRGQHWFVSTGSLSAPKPRQARPAPNHAAGNSVLTGMAASRGEVTGTVCVVRGPEEFAKLRKGQVLVAPFTAPAWTPLFRLAAAVVTDIGNPTSHAAIVAREYGLPAVVATGTGTSLLHDGQQVRVNGGQGTVTVIGEA